MSLNPSLPHGIRRTYRIFWCYQCHRTVRIISSSDDSSDAFCPRCFGQFLHEIDFPRPRFLVDFTDLHPQLLDAYSPLFRPSTRLRITTEFDQIRRPPSDPNTQSPWIVGRAPPIVPVPPQEHAIPAAVHPGDYFAGPGLNELIGELTQNDRPGPPPAPNSAIDAMPTVPITEEHLTEGSQCPVCKEEFAIGEEGREMPCKHVYHSDCIVPWLRIHNSCPVCRFRLPGNSVEDEHRMFGEMSQRDGDSDRRRGRWNPLSLLWPFRSSSPSWDYPNYRSRQEAEEHPDTGGAFYSWWRSWFLL